MSGMILRLQKKYGEFIHSGAQLFFLAVGVLADSHELRMGCLSLLAVISLFAWMTALRRRRAIVDTPTSRIASAAQGVVELSGQGKPVDPPLFSRLNGLPCLWYHYQVEKKQHDDWKMIIDEESDLSFILDDGSGCCVVDVEGAEILTRHKETRSSENHRTTEWKLLVGDLIYARGEFHTLGGGTMELDAREDVGNLLAEWKKDPARLLKRFDLNGDGLLDETEWNLARQAARREVSRLHRELRNDADVHTLRRPGNDQPYLISNFDPQRLARRFLLRAGAHLTLFLASLATMAWVWQQAS